VILEECRPGSDWSLGAMKHHLEVASDWISVPMSAVLDLEKWSIHRGGLLSGRGIRR